MKLVTLLLLVIGLVTAQTNWRLDTSHSSVGFAIDHMVISEVEGNFGKFTGSVVSKSDDFIDADISFEIETNSISTNHEKRDAHLKNEDFFNVTKYPKITFKSKSLKQVKGKKYKLVGDFTMHGVTKTIELDVKFNGIIKDPWGNTRSGFKVTGELNRTDYGLKYGGVMEAGGLVIGHDVALNINLEFVKTK